VGLVALRAAVAVAAIIALAVAMGAGAEQQAPPGRVEAHSSDLLAVGTVHDDRMTIHLSRTVDNAPVRDAAVAVSLRGASHPATAEADGSYSMQTPDLRLPGPAAVQFEVTQGTAHEVLSGMLEGEHGEQSDDRSNTRQLGWWVLNFAVCIGFLVLWSRRKKNTEDG
jgi:hypothetical protein